MMKYERGNREKGKGKREEGMRSVAKRVAPNEPKLRAKGRPGMGRGRKDEVQSTKDENECEIEEVVSGQFSVVSRLFSGDPQGSTFQLRNADCGMRNRGSCQWSVFSYQ